MLSRVNSRNRVLFIHLFTVKLLMKLLSSTQHYRRCKKWAFIHAFLLKQVCSQTEKSVVPYTFCWALRKLQFLFSFSLLVWDYRRLALIVLKLWDDSVKGEPSLLNCSHCSGFLCLSLRDPRCLFKLFLKKKFLSPHEFLKIVKWRYYVIIIFFSFPVEWLK